jgi:hypothetical protein
MRKIVTCLAMAALACLTVAGCKLSPPVHAVAAWLDCTPLTCNYSGSTGVSVSQRGTVSAVNGYNRATHQCMVTLQETWPTSSTVSGGVNTSHHGCTKISSGSRYLIYSSGQIKIK